MKPLLLLSAACAAMLWAPPASAQSCDPAPGAGRAGALRRLASDDLRELRRSLRDELRAAKRAAPGLRRYHRLGGLEGSTYGARAFRLGAGACDEELQSMVTSILRPSPDDWVYYSDAHPIPYAEAPKIDAAFDADRRGDAVEARAVRRLAEEIEAFVAAHPDLRVFVVSGGWADAVGGRDAGVAIVDPATREAFWVYGRASWSA